MCLIIAGVFSFLSYSFYTEGSFINAVINGLIAVFFIALLIRNILKMKAERKKGNSD
jgi:large-conductance mechanosensitive channel